MGREESFFSLIKQLLACVGVSNPTEDRTYSVRNKILQFIVACGVINVYFVMSNVLLAAMFKKLDFLKRAFLCAMGLLMAEINVKLFYLLYKGDSFLRLVKRIDNYPWEGLSVRNSVTGKRTSYGYVIILDRIIQWYLTLSLLWVLVVAVLWTLFSDSPSFIDGFLPFEGSPKYQYTIVSTCQILSGITFTFTIVSFNTFYIKLVLLICSQLEWVDEAFRSIPQNALSADVNNWEDIGTAVSHKSAHQLRRIIARHQEMLRLMRYIRDLYSPVFFVEYLVAIIVLCISLYLTLTIAEYDYEFGIICLMWAHKLPQLFLYSWFGTKLSDVADSVRNAAYACEWYNTPKSFSICILIVLIRCDQSFTFTAGDYASVTVNSFVAADSVRNAAYACEWYNTPKSFSICILIVLIRCDQSFTFTAGDYASVTVNSFVAIMKEAISYMAVMHTLMSSDGDQMVNVTQYK